MLLRRIIYRESSAGGSDASQQQKLVSKCSEPGPGLQTESVTSAKLIPAVADSHERLPRSGPVAAIAAFATIPAMRTAKRATSAGHSLSSSNSIVRCDAAVEPDAVGARWGLRGGGFGSRRGGRRRCVARCRHRGARLCRGGAMPLCEQWLGATSTHPVNSPDRMVFLESPQALLDGGELRLVDEGNASAQTLGPPAAGGG